MHRGRDSPQLLILNSRLFVLGDGGATVERLDPHTQLWELLPALIQPPYPDPVSAIVV